MRNIAIIPARSGSKRLPKKNIRLFLGKPIIAYSIEVALNSGLFEEVMVSTDQPIISEIAKKYGAKVPFLRSENSSTDYANLSDVIFEVIHNYKKLDMEFDNFCCILATAPFLTSNRLLEGYELLKHGGFHSVFPILRYSYPIQRSLEIKNGKIKMVNPENLNTRSQDLPERYHDSGQFYWMRINEFLKEGIFFTSNTGAIILKENEVQDIDTKEDWDNAVLKYKIINNKI
jgi:pseudaminic acid cytidylyltransferase